MSRTVQIANTILSQIRAGGVQAMMCWGFRSPKAFGPQHFGEGHNGGVFFQVSGFKWKGKVMVKLMLNDTYRVELGTLRKGVWKCKEAVDGIYCDMLTTTIDSMVETDDDSSEEYKQKVMNAKYQF